MDAINLSKYIIKSGKESGINDISNKKLQKLLYYVQAWTLVLYDKKAFNDEIEAWVHGPAIPDVYRQYKNFVFEAIPPEAIGDVKKIDEDVTAVVKDVELYESATTGSGRIFFFLIDDAMLDYNGTKIPQSYCCIVSITNKHLRT